MKILFDKNTKGEISVRMATGTVAEDFSYTKMIKQLLLRNQFEDTQYKGLTTDEKARIEAMLEKINEAMEEEEEDI